MNSFTIFVQSDEFEPEVSYEEIEKVMQEELED